MTSTLRSDHLIPARDQARDGAVRLDNLTLARKEGWRCFVTTPARTPPEPLTTHELRALGEGALVDYNRRRREWHANLGPIKTPQLAALHEDLWDIVDSNAQDGDKAKGAIAIDAFPGLGKTTSVLAFAKQFHLREIAEHGELTEDGHEQWPVCRVGLTGNTGMKDFNRAMLEYFGHPGHQRGTTAQFAHRALDCMLSCQVKLLIVDEALPAVAGDLRRRGEQPVQIHRRRVPGDVGAHRRRARRTRPVLRRRLLHQRRARTGRTPHHRAGHQAVHRRHRHRAAGVAADAAGIEQRLALAEKHPGMLADELADYLFARSTGHIGSLMTLVNRGCQRAVRTGTERLTQDLLDGVKNDAAAEMARRELEAAIQARRLTTRVTQTRRRAG